MNWWEDTKECVRCGAEFGPYRKHGPKKWAERRYCTAGCAGKDGGDKIRLPDEQHRPAYRNGYRLLWNGRRGRFIYEHRLVMEAHLGRDLPSAELVHHRNHDKLDNRLENLEVMSRPKHQSLHTAGRDRPELRGRRTDPVPCAWCRTLFWPKAKRLKCCSQSCGQKLRYSQT